MLKRNVADNILSSCEGGGGGDDESRLWEAGEAVGEAREGEKEMIDFPSE